MDAGVMRACAAAVGLVLLAVAALTAAQEPPWRERRRPGVRPNLMAGERVLPEDWPAEPEPPLHVDAARLAKALEELCGFLPRGQGARFAAEILHSADDFSVDPFLLGALVQRMGRCNPTKDALGGVGLTLIPPAMYAAHLRRGAYRYWLRDGAGWVERVLAVDRHPFAAPRLRRPEANLYFAAALLSAWREQHRDVDAAFEQAPHRHHVSHFIWGDRVRSARAEDRVLLDRRRLLFYYGAIDAHPPLRRLGVELGSPLDGAPRVVSSFLGDNRDGGVRRHRGVDVESVLREPVRAVADGRVNFAGVDLPGRGTYENMTPDEIAKVPRKDLGAGGRYVCILHGREGGGWLRSCYMHLEDVEVRHGQTVRRGDRIGTVGRTGMKISSPHLHLELHGPEGLLDPAEVMQGLLLGRAP
jgi:murein DD-endopeptidase MepM/ murein hydrolase activator NlpD